MASVAIVYDADAPFIGLRPSEGDLALLSSRGELVDFSRLERSSCSESWGCLVSLHGAYFPRRAWPQVRRHLERGGALVCLGGETPFSRPVDKADGGAWNPAAPQAAYYEELNILQGMPISASRIARLEANCDEPLLSGFEACFHPTDTLSFVVQFSHTDLEIAECGSGGPMDARLYPLIRGFASDGTQSAAPAIMIDNLRGPYAGSRWAFLNISADEPFWRGGGADLLSMLAERCSDGVVDIGIRPNYASYEDGERPLFLLNYQALGGGARSLELDIRVTKDGRELHSSSFFANVDSEMRYASVPASFLTSPGLYELRADVSLGGHKLRTLRTGFWGMDRVLLERGDDLRCGEDYFTLGGKPAPIVGMTYMQADVHRQFIYLPNMWLWDRDLSELAASGINLVRTGIWTGYRQIMYNDGFPSEEILRAIDAFVLAAKSKGLHIVFTFFAFAPEAWAGINPFLDPRSLAAQKRYVSSIVSRHARTTGISWDLINEPTVGDPKSLWWPVPNGDSYEAAAWREWLRRRYGAVERLAEAWDFAFSAEDFSEIQLPSPASFKARDDSIGTAATRAAADYLLFAQDVMVWWADAMVQAIRALGAGQLVTIGQDQALNGRRPSTFFYGSAVDYTTDHTWGSVDDLYHDCIFYKTPGKPNLIQETGVFFARSWNGGSRMSEEDMRDIMERKFAIAFAANNAGAVHWIWNMNVYNKSAQEAHIGALFADGTRKLEAQVSRDFGAFMRETGWMLSGRKKASVAAVYPYSGSFSARPWAPASTKRFARIFGYSLCVPFEAYGEYDLERLGSEPLIALPSPCALRRDAWNRLIERVRSGATLLVTGPFSRDEHFRTLAERRALFGSDSEIRGVLREERIAIEGEDFRAPFGGEGFNYLEKEVGSGGYEIRALRLGAGSAILCPLPLELCLSDAALVALYRYALKVAGVRAPLEFPSGKGAGLLVRKIDFHEGSLFVAVSEQAEQETVSLVDTVSGRTFRFVVPANRAALFAVDSEANIVASYRDLQVSVDVEGPTGLA